MGEPEDRAGCAPGWLPIETAPREKVIWIADPSHVWVGWWHEPGGFWFGEAMHRVAHSARRADFEPTHWHPIGEEHKDALIRDIWFEKMTAVLSVLKQA
jgi:hypothetical protein